MNKIYNFKDLKAYTWQLADTWATLAKEAHRTAKDRVKAPHLQAEIESLKSEIAALKAQIVGQREEESQAGKHALRLYWDNCNLEKYRHHANGILHEWISRSEHDVMRKNYDRLKIDHAALTKSNNEMEKAWMDYVKSITVKTSPPRTAKAK